jgi:hypothetical protein
METNKIERRNDMNDLSEIRKLSAESRERAESPNPTGLHTATIVKLCDAIDELTVEVERLRAALAAETEREGWFFPDGE